MRPRLRLDGVGDPGRHAALRGVSAGRISNLTSFAGATAQADGRFLIDRLRPASYTLSFWIDGMEIPVLPAGPPVEVDPQSDRFLELRVPAPGTLTGRTLFHGAPVPLCEVAFHSGDYETSVKADKNGTYRLTLPTTVRGEVVAQRGDVATTPWVQAEIVSGYTRTLDLRFDDVHLAGRVVSAVDGMPVPYAELSFDELADGAPRGMPFTRQSGADGRFNVDRMYPGTWRITTHQPVYLHAAPTDVVVTEAGLADVRIELTKGAQLSGTVLGHDGKPTRNAIRLHLLPRGEGRSAVGYLITHQPFRLTGLPGGDYDYYVIHGIQRHTGTERAELEERALASGELQLVAGEVTDFSAGITRTDVPDKPASVHWSGTKKLDVSGR